MRRLEEIQAEIAKINKQIFDLKNSARTPEERKKVTPEINKLEKEEKELIKQNPIDPNNLK